MTNTYDTSGEPLGSTAVRVLYNNASNLDDAVNSTENTWVDRPPFGRIRRTWWGMEQDFNQFLINSGFEPVHLIYVDGSPLVVDRPTQFIDRAGLVYRVKMPANFPVTLTGTWATDQNLLVDVGDQSLRSALAATGGAGLVGFDENLTYPANTIGEALTKLPKDVMPSVAEFGIVPDGVTDWESSPSADWAGLKAAAITTGVRWPAGKTDAEYYACGINFDKTWDGARMHFEPGSVLGGVFHLISGADAANQYGLSSAVRSGNIVTLVTSSAHGFVTGDRIQVRRTFQTYVAGIATMDTDDAVCTVVNSTTLTYPSVGPNGSATISGQPFGPAYVNNSPLMNVHISGKLTTTDRFGTINCKDCYIEYCHVLNDPARHSAYPGTGARGAHLYVGTDGLRVGELVIDYATGANTAAAFALDGNAWNPSNCSFDRIHIKDSAYNGAYITGGGHAFGELRIDGFANEAPNGEVLQDSDGLAQTEEFKGFWVNRCWGTTIDSLITNQRAQDGTRGFENAQALIDQTGHPSYITTLNSGVTIKSWTARNVRRNGLRFGDNPTYNSFTCVCDVGTLEVRAAPEGVVSGAYLVDCQGGSLLSAINFGVIRLIGTAANLGVRTTNLSNVAIGSLIGLDHANQLLQAAGRVVVGSIYGRTTSSSVPTKPVVNIVGSGGASYGSRIGSIDVQSTIAKATQVFLSDGNAGKWVVGSIRSQGYVPTTGAVYIDNPTLGWSIENLDLAGTGSAGVGVGFNGTIAAGKLGGGRVTGFATGFAKGTATFTAASNAAIAVQSVSNTTNTDLLAASFDKLACSGVTL